MSAAVIMFGRAVRYTCDVGGCNERCTVMPDQYPKDWIEDHARDLCAAHTGLADPATALSSLPEETKR